MYTNPITSPSFDFITYLSLTTSFPVPDLVKVSSITNLGVLEIIGKSGRSVQSVGDRLIRAWQHAALENGSFPLLRILKLWHYEDVTSQSLSYLNSFPSLAIYDVRGCAFSNYSKVNARELGWTPSMESNIPGLLESACLERVALIKASPGFEWKRKSSRRRKADQTSNRVRRIPRSDIPAFLTRKDPDTTDPELKMKRRRKQGLSKSLSTDVQEMWDSPICKAFARIGELRNDLDLARAGVVIGDQAIVNDELVTSVPMFSLRLGNAPSTHLERPLAHGVTALGAGTQPHLDGSSSMETPGLVFTRIKLPPKAERDPELLGKVGNEIPGQKEIEVVPARRAKRIRRNNERDLGDMLSSFT